jgi:hypothetical protein
VGISRRRSSKIEVGCCRNVSYPAEFFISRTIKSTGSEIGDLSEKTTSRERWIYSFGPQGTPPTLKGRAWPDSHCFTRDTLFCHFRRWWVDMISFFYCLFSGLRIGSTSCHSWSGEIARVRNWLRVPRRSFLLCRRGDTSELVVVHTWTKSNKACTYSDALIVIGVLRRTN